MVTAAQPAWATAIITVVEVTEVEVTVVTVTVVEVTEVTAAAVEGGVVGEDVTAAAAVVDTVDVVVGGGAGAALPRSPTSTGMAAGSHLAGAPSCLKVSRHGAMDHNLVP